MKAIPGGQTQEEELVAAIEESVAIDVVHRDRDGILAKRIVRSGLIVDPFVEGEPFQREPRLVPTGLC